MKERFRKTENKRFNPANTLRSSWSRIRRILRILQIRKIRK